MAPAASRVILHMAASLDGYIARPDGRVDWMETADTYTDGETLEPDAIETFLRSIDCYVMGSRTYETALNFEAQGYGWVYGDKPTFVLTRRQLPRNRDSIQFIADDLSRFVNETLRPRYGLIWVAGGGMLCTEMLRLGLADQISYAILPVLIGEGLPFFNPMDSDIPLHLKSVKAYKSGMVELHYDVIKQPAGVTP
ncbi:MAG: hypothetical protein RLZZ385_301 [Pseudomonadota bacterium]|jgi:dihydrofolate reductase